MVPKLFIDSDVILDLLLDRDPFSEPAKNLFLLAENGRAKLYTSPIVFANCHYILRKLKPRAAVWKIFHTLNSIVTCVKMDEETLRITLNSHFTDFEDGLQNSCAHQAGLGIIVTRNVKDYKTSLLLVLTPAEAVIRFSI